jgi:hypothetical protein
MTDKQENKFSMFLSTEQVCADNTAIWTTVPAFGTAFGTFQTGIVGIQNLRVQQETDLKGIAEDKANKQTALISSALGIAKPIVAYANATNNPQLRQEVDYSESDLTRSRDTDVETICTLIHARANTNAAALVAYGVTAPMITDLGTAITDYHPTIAGPRSAIAVRKQQTAAIEQLIKETNEILTGQLDQLIVLFETSAPEFFNSYKNARIIVDLGGGQNTWSGTVGGGTIDNIMDAAGNDETVWELTNEGTEELKFGRGVNSSDMGTPVTVAAGTTEMRTALELGASGNKFLNVQNQGVTEGSYKVVRD